MPSPASALGQKIGETFDAAVLRLLRKYADELGFELLEPEKGRKIIRLEATHGVPKQMDNVIVEKGTNDPLVIIEIKWLKDSRHIYDKGGWIGGMEKIQYQIPTIRGGLAILAGYWSARILQQLQHGQQVTAIVMATVEEAYDILKRHGVVILIDKKTNAFANPAEALNQFKNLSQEEMETIGNEIVEKRAKDVYQALQALLAPVDKLTVDRIEIALHTNQGNILYQTFTSTQEAHEFIDRYTGKEASMHLKKALKEASNTRITSQ